jgi:hypothetical protein
MKMPIALALAASISIPGQPIAQGSVDHARGNAGFVQRFADTVYVGTILKLCGTSTPRTSTARTPRSRAGTSLASRTTSRGSRSALQVPAPIAACP